MYIPRYVQYTLYNAIMYIVHHVSGASNQGAWLSCRQIETRKQQSGIGLVEDLHRIRPECFFCDLTNV